MSSLKRYEPKPTDFCLCGSGLAFRICCHVGYRPEKISEIRKLLTAGEPQKALELTRQFLTWYRLSHESHTAPLMRAGVKEIKGLLTTDIGALEEITNLMCDCLVALGSPHSFDEVLKCVGNAIDDPRWRDAVFAMRVDYIWRILEDEEATWAFISSSPDFLITKRDNVFLAWLNTSPERIPTTLRLAVLARLRKNTIRPDVLMHVDLLESAYRVAIRGDEGAIEIVRTGINKFRAVPHGQRSAFGVLKFSQALSLLGGWTRDVGLLEESLAEAQHYLKMSNDFPKESTRELVLCECGEVSLFLNMPDRAIAFFESALLENPSRPLPTIFMARAYIRKGTFTKTRELLMGVESRIKSHANKMDFAYVSAELGIATAEKADIEIARSRLEACGQGVGIFEDYRIDYLNLLASKKAPTAKVAGSMFWRSFVTRYLMLEPNFCGIGLRINAITEDAINAHEKRKGVR